MAYTDIRMSSPPPTDAPADLVPKPSVNPKPNYPWLARRRKYEGSVTVHIEVTPEGQCREATIQKSSGYDLLDESALEAVRQWKFEPARRLGIPAAGALDVTFEFRLTPAGG
jgi:protein TonB